jgi:hypothetical protein
VQARTEEEDPGSPPDMEHNSEATGAASSSKETPHEIVNVPDGTRRDGEATAGCAA